MNYVVSEEPQLIRKGTVDNCVQSFDSPGQVAKGVTILPPADDKSSREILGYNVYRGPYDGAAEDMTLIGIALDTTYNDNTWGSAEAGIYKWAVEVIYEYNFSEFVYSNFLDKDMYTEVSVAVITNSDDSPIGTDVLFVNVSEPADPVIEYETELDDTGLYTWTEFRKGTYDILVHLNGFTDIVVEGVEIWDVSTFEFILEEMLAPVADLYVTPTGFATWRSGGIVPFEPYAFDFEADAEGWEIQGNVDGWQWGNNASLSSTYMSFDGNATNFIAVNADAAGSGGASIDVFTKSPELNCANADQIFVTFDYMLVSDNMSIYYSIGDGEPVLVETLAGSSSWINYTVEFPEEVLEADAHILFHFVENGTWGYGGAVDNVTVTDGSERYASRELDYYKVWHDGIFSLDTDTTFYQYGDMGEVLIPGETYLAGFTC